MTIQVEIKVLVIQKKTGCDDDEAIEAAWDIFDYMGKPDSLPATPEVMEMARKIIRR